MQILKQIKQLADINKFSFSQACSDNNGKSTLMPISGVFLILVGGIMFVYAGFTKQSEVLSQSVVMAGLGSSILIGRKIMNGQPKLEEVPLEETSIEEK